MLFVQFQTLLLAQKENNEITEDIDKIVYLLTNNHHSELNTLCATPSTFSWDRHVGGTIGVRKASRG